MGWRPGDRGEAGGEPVPGPGVPGVAAASGAPDALGGLAPGGETPRDLVRDVTETVTSLCARLYGRRAAADRAARAVEAITGDSP